jgi:hypothetical protein
MPISVSGAGRPSGLASVDGPADGPPSASGPGPAGDPASAGGAGFGPDLTLPGRVEPAPGDLLRGWVGFLVLAAPFAVGAALAAVGGGISPDGDELA